RALWPRRACLPGGIARRIRSKHQTRLGAGGNLEPRGADLAVHVERRRRCRGSNADTPVDRMRRRSILSVFTIKGSASVVPRKFVAGLVPASPVVSQLAGAARSGAAAVWASAGPVAASAKTIVEKITRIDVCAVSVILHPSLKF